MWIDRTLPTLQSQWALGFTVAAVLTAAGVAAKAFLPITTLAPVFAAILIATFVSGWKAGLLAAALGFIANWYLFLAPAPGWRLSPSSIVDQAFYAAFCLLLIMSVAALNEALARLSRQRKRLRLAMEIAKLGAWRWTPPDQLEWDSSARAMLGLRPEDRFPTMDEFISWVHPADRSYFDEAVARIRKDNAVPEQEYRVVTPDGQTRWLHIFAPRILREGETTFGIGQDVTDRKEKEERIKALLAEVAHRVKNQYAVILALIRETARHSRTPRVFQERVQSRITALARSHDLLIGGEWIGVSIADLVKAHIEPFCEVSRCEVSGPHVLLKPAAVQYFGMALHELATNSIKYGALSGPQGKVTIAWSVAEKAGETPALKFSWSESGGPRVRRSARSGFGLQVLEQLAPAALQGPGKLSFNRSGVVWTIEASRGVLVE